jgi:hypothetical protein
MVVSDVRDVLHEACVVHAVQGEPVIVVARCRWWTYYCGEGVCEWNMNDASDGETNCMACVATETA